MRFIMNEKTFEKKRQDILNRWNSLLDIPNKTSWQWAEIKKAQAELNSLHEKFYSVSGLNK